MVLTLPGPYLYTTPLLTIGLTHLTRVFSIAEPRGRGPDYYSYGNGKGILIEKRPWREGTHHSREERSFCRYKYSSINLIISSSTRTPPMMVNFTLTQTPN